MLRRPRQFSQGEASGRTAYSLVEVLLALAVLVLLGMVILPGVGSILRQANQRDGLEALTQAVEMARSRAIESGRTVRLSHDAPARSLVVSGNAPSRVPLPAGLELELLPSTASGFVLLGGMLTEVGGVGHARFFPDGTCDPFRVRLRPERFAPRLLAVDPWTGALNELTGEVK